jgi:hypothetical protein
VGAEGAIAAVRTKKEAWSLAGVPERFLVALVPPVLEVFLATVPPSPDHWREIISLVDHVKSANSKLLAQLAATRAPDLALLEYLP